ncbi:hypothetical protein [Streptomyces sp. NPDC060243]|uniref:hypothetical protein n=1 Tax=Streptomyces sp. NPDC060243 TaxID=3347081 RepID=UPI0036671272
MSDQPAGPILDGLGHTFDLDDGDFVVSALVIAKIVGPDGDVSLTLSTSDGLSWIDQNGLLASAQQIVNSNEVQQREDGE